MKTNRFAAIIAAFALAATGTTGCGSGSNDSNSATTNPAAGTAMTTASADSGEAISDSDAVGSDTPTSADASTGSAGLAAQGDAGDRGGPGAFGKNVDASTITTVDQLNALINEAYGDGGLGLHRGHHPVEQVLIDTLGISHDEMHVRMDAGQNLAAIAEDQGIGTQTLIDALVTNWQPAIANLKTEGLVDADYHQALVDGFTFKVTWNGTDEPTTFTGV